ncbi:MAG: hypothetical protein M1469_03835 [Bacteroidetes bacterium]|nr:hypothetical protein [Bacteroidota bacterium]
MPENVRVREAELSVPGWAVVVLFISLFSFRNAAAQPFSATAGLGLEYFNSPSLSKYLNFAAPGAMPLGSYQSAIQFVAVGEYFISRDWAIALEYGYITKTVSTGSTLGSQQIDFSYYLPTIMLRRVVAGEGYYIQFGGGVGYHFGGLNTTTPYSDQTANYSCQGLGFKVDAILDTQLGEKLYARVDAEARADFTGPLKLGSANSLTYIDYNTEQPHSVDMSFGGVGITFGIVYYF